MSWQVNVKKQGKNTLTGGVLRWRRSDETALSDSRESMILFGLALVDITKQSTITHTHTQPNDGNMAIIIDTPIQIDIN